MAAPDDRISVEHRVPKLRPGLIARQTIGLWNWHAPMHVMHQVEDHGITDPRLAVKVAGGFVQTFVMFTMEAPGSRIPLSYCKRCIGPAQCDVQSSQNFSQSHWREGLQYPVESLLSPQEGLTTCF